jgi:hypothetical protein
MDITGATTQSNVTPEWSNAIAMSFDDPFTQIGGVTATKYAIPSPTTDRDDFEVVPAAVSFQVTGTDSLQAASGAVYLGRIKMCLNAPDPTDTQLMEDFYDNLLGFSNPKVLSVAKLAMNPQQVNLLPGNNTEIQDFRSLEQDTSNEAAVWWDRTDGLNKKYEFAGFKPGYIYNPNGRPLLITVCVQWRLRLSPRNPMHATQVLHPPTNPSHFHKLIKAAEDVTHGVEDVGLAGAAGYLATGGASETGLLGSMGEAFSGMAGLLPEVAEFAPLLLL